MLTGSLSRRTPGSPAVPVDCAHCPISSLTVCQPFHGPQLDIVQSFKVGDRILPAGSQLYAPGQELTELYNLLDGWVLLYRDLESGQRQILDLALPGSFIGYQPDLHLPMLHGAECLTDVAVCGRRRRSTPSGKSSRRSGTSCGPRRRRRWRLS